MATFCLAGSLRTSRTILKHYASVTTTSDEKHLTLDVSLILEETEQNTFHTDWRVMLLLFLRACPSGKSIPRCRNSTLNSENFFAGLPKSMLV